MSTSREPQPTSQQFEKRAAEWDTSIAPLLRHEQPLVVAQQNGPTYSLDNWLDSIGLDLKRKHPDALFKDPTQVWEKALSTLLNGVTPSTAIRSSDRATGRTLLGGDRDQTGNRLQLIARLLREFESLAGFQDINGIQFREAGRVAILDAIGEQVRLQASASASEQFPGQRTQIETRIDLLRRLLTLLEGGSHHIAVGTTGELPPAPFARTRVAEVGQWVRQPDQFWNGVISRVTDTTMGVGRLGSTMPALMTQIDQTMQVLFQPLQVGGQTAQSALADSETLASFVRFGQLAIDAQLAILEPSSEIGRQQIQFLLGLRNYLSLGTHAQLDQFLPNITATNAFKQVKQAEHQARLPMDVNQARESVRREVTSVVDAIASQTTGPGGYVEQYQEKLGELWSLVGAAEGRNMDHWLHALLEETFEQVSRALEDISMRLSGGNQGAREAALLSFAEQVFSKSKDAFVRYETFPGQLQSFLPKYARWQRSKWIGHLGRASAGRTVTVGNREVADINTWPRQLKTAIEAKILRADVSVHEAYFKGAVSDQIGETLAQMYADKQHTAAYRLMEDIFLMFATDSPLLDMQASMAQEAIGAHPGQVSVAIQRSLARFALKSEAFQYYLGQRHSHSSPFTADFAQLLNAISSLIERSHIAQPAAVVARIEEANASGQDTLTDEEAAQLVRNLAQSALELDVGHVAPQETLLHRISATSDFDSAKGVDQVGALLGQLEQICPATFVETLRELHCHSGELGKWMRTNPAEVIQAEETYSNLTSRGKNPLNEYEADAVVATRHGVRNMRSTTRAPLPEKLRLSANLQNVIKVVLSRMRKFDASRQILAFGGLVTRFDSPKTAAGKVIAVPSKIRVALEYHQTARATALRTTMDQILDLNHGYLSFGFLTDENATRRELGSLVLVFVANLLRDNRSHLDLSTYREHFIHNLGLLLTTPDLREDVRELLLYILRTKVRDYYPLDSRQRLIGKMDEYILTGDRPEIAKDRYAQVIMALGYRDPKHFNPQRLPIVVADLRPHIVQSVQALINRWVTADGETGRRSLILDLYDVADKKLVQHLTADTQLDSRRIDRSGQEKAEIKRAVLLIAWQLVNTFKAETEKDKPDPAVADVLDQIKNTLHDELVLLAQAHVAPPVFAEQYWTGLELASDQMQSMVKAARVKYATALEAYAALFVPATEERVGTTADEDRADGSLGRELVARISKIARLTEKERDDLTQKAKQVIKDLAKEGPIGIGQLVQDAVERQDEDVAVTLVDRYEKLIKGIGDPSIIEQVLQSLADSTRMHQDQQQPVNGVGSGQAINVTRVDLPIGKMIETVLDSAQTEAAAEATTAIAQRLLQDQERQRQHLIDLLKRNHVPDHQINQAQELQTVIHQMVLTSLSVQGDELSAFATLSQRLLEARQTQVNEQLKLIESLELTHLEAWSITQQQWSEALAKLKAELVFESTRIASELAQARTDLDTLANRARALRATITQKLDQWIDEYTIWVEAVWGPRSLVVALANQLSTDLAPRGIRVSPNDLLPLHQDLLGRSPVAVWSERGIPSRSTHSVLAAVRAGFAAS